MIFDQGDWPKYLFFISMCKIFVGGKICKIIKFKLLAYTSLKLKKKKSGLFK